MTKYKRVNLVDDMYSLIFVTTFLLLNVVVLDVRLINGYQERGKLVSHHLSDRVIIIDLNSISISDAMFLLVMVWGQLSRGLP